jgi:hypothetical protein
MYPCLLRIQSDTVHAGKLERAFRAVICICALFGRKPRLQMSYAVQKPASMKLEMIPCGGVGFDVPNGQHERCRRQQLDGTRDGSAGGESRAAHATTRATCARATHASDTRDASEVRRPRVAAAAEEKGHESSTERLQQSWMQDLSYDLSPASDASARSEFREEVGSRNARGG